MTSTPWRMSASQSTSAPIRAWVRGRASDSIALRARSISAAAAVPALGTCRPTRGWGVVAFDWGTAAFGWPVAGPPG
jgi:hypothetical protein